VSFTRDIKEELCSDESRKHDALNGFLHAVRGTYHTDSETVADFLAAGLTGYTVRMKDGRYSVQVKNASFDRVQYVCDSPPRRFTAGIFLACGSAANPDIEYYLDLTFENAEKCGFARTVIERQGIKINASVKRNRHFLYIKDGDVISDFLALIGAPVCAMRIINARIYKELTNNVNRAVNCDSANIEKTVRTSAKLRSDIEFILRERGERALHGDLLKTAVARAENTDMSLRELGEVLGMSKSGVSRRFSAISDIAEKIRNGKTKM